MSDLTSQELRKVLATAVGQDPSAPEVDQLMHALDRTKLFRYHNDEGVQLLSTVGKVLAAIVEDPTLTQRAMSVYLGCSEQLVDKKVKLLVDSGLITKTKVNRRNVYEVNRKSVLKHSDITHLRQVMQILADMEKVSIKGKTYSPKDLEAADPPKVVKREAF